MSKSRIMTVGLTLVVLAAAYRVPAARKALTGA